MGPIEIVLIWVLPTVLILIGAGVVIMRREDAKLRWIAGVLLWTLAALLVVYVITAILSRMI